MSVKGGYIIVDLKGVDFTSGTPEIVEGAYKAASNPWNKAVLISGLQVAGVYYPDIFIPLVPNAGTYEGGAVFGGNTFTFSIASDDSVTITKA